MANETVQVGCRVGHGLVLRVYDRVDSLEFPGQKMPREIGQIELKGPRSEHFRQGRAGAEPGVAYTAVDKRLFDLWYAENKDGDLIKGGTVVVPVVAGDEKKLSEDEVKARDRERAQAKIVAAGQLSTGGADARILAIGGTAAPVEMPQRTDEETKAKIDRMNGDPGA